MAAPLSSKESGDLSDSDSSSFKVSTQERNKRNASIVSAACAGVFVGFAFTLFRARRKDPLFFKKMKVEADVPETGILLASKALACGTVLAVTGFSLLGFLTFRITGVNNLEEFNTKMRTYFPGKPSEGKTNFKSLRELADYLISEDRKSEQAKKAGNKQYTDSDET